MSEPKKSYWKRWYDAGGKEKLAEQRQAKYANDPAYREKAKKNAADYRAKQRERQPQPPDEYQITYQDAADILDVSTTVLHRWRQKRWIPTPYTFKGRILFTKTQITLLGHLASFLADHPRNHTEKQLKQLDSIVANILSNW